MSSPMHSCRDMFALDEAFPHAWACAPSRQFEIAECRLPAPPPNFVRRRAVPYKLYCNSPHMCSPPCLVIFWRQFDKYSSSCWSVEVRSLDGCSCSLALAHSPGRLSCTSCGDGCTPLLRVLPWRTAPDQATRLCCDPKPSFPQAEQFLFIVVHEPCT